MIHLVYFLVIIIATTLGAVAGLGGGVIIKPLLDLVGYHDASTINLYSCIAVFAMCCVSLTKQLRAGFAFDGRMVLAVSAGSLVGGVVGDKLFGTLTDSFDNHLVKAVQAGALAVVLTLILVYALKQSSMPQWRLTHPAAIFVAGLALGALAVFLGIGGGPLNVCALSLLFSLGAKEGAVYSLAIIFFSQLSKLGLSVASGALWAADLMFVPTVVIPGVAGGFIGTAANRRLSEQGVRRIYVTVMCLLPLVSLYNCVTNVLALT